MAYASSKERYNLHVRTNSADKVREVAAKCNLSCSEVLTRMIDYACDHVTYQKNESFTLSFCDDGSLDCEVKLA